MKNSDMFRISALSIDCGYSLEPPRRGGSNEYPQSMFLSRNKKNNVYPCKPQFYYIKVGLRGSKLYRACFRDETLPLQVYHVCCCSRFKEDSIKTKGNVKQKNQMCFVLQLYSIIFILFKTFFLGYAEVRT